ncbi:hypothetical protein NBRC10513v2_000179 [Rhodotorula toruloides]|uniref:Uncharacterized protein n=1 Tax=Rhodotorula toruloides TaxID=5286 RepID=A0A0K3CE98_RHOTO|nr:hypothetical protein AAT19DRAFT_12531 [Rhodotorula toruloides]
MRLRLLLSGFAAIAATASTASAASSAPISVTVQQSVHVGDAIKFQWTGGTPPYTLKVYLNDKVVSQNQGWSTNYVQWRASADQVPAGTSVRVRVTDSSGQTVMSEPTVVEGDGKSASTKKGSPDADSTGHIGGHGKTSADEEPITGAVDTKSLMDDPNNRFRTSNDIGAPTGQIGGGMLSAAVMPSDWLPGQDLSSSRGTITLMPLGSASLSAFMASATPDATSGNSAAITDALASTAATASASSAVATDISDAAGSTTPTDSASAAASSDSGVSSSSSSSSSGGLSTTAIVAIAGVILLLLAAGGGFWWWRSKQKDNSDQQQPQQSGAGKGRSKRKSRRSGNSSESGGDEEKLVGGRGGEGNPNDSETEPSDGGRRGGGRGGSYRDDPPTDNGSGTDDDFQQRRSSRRSR